MDNITIGLWVTGGMLVLVVLGMRVAFAAALAGFIGIVWIFWAKFGYAPEKFLYWNERREIWDGALGKSIAIAGSVPHSKVSSQALSLIPTFILIGYLAYHAKLTTALFRGCQALDRMGAGRVGRVDRLCHGGVCRCVRRVGCNGGRLCPYCHSGDVEIRL